ncbi:response regulator transcription factor [Verrucomicrobiales bacterium]|jgi:two-component system, OmpR family, alkaline phosphatase synthesis response regulator PhoP|nr:response regulator transcription factor [Verrucomicrobiales bacterium]MDB4358942.1 response regulator transcription factor [Verrucomicrobiales bacterium]
MKILIAEDDPVSLDSIEACLSGEGFSTLLAKNGNEAIQMWEAEKPDLVCLDIMMPEKDGFEVCRHIRESDKSLPILFLSAKNEEIDVVVGLELGADDFIRKPFGKHELIARIRSVLRRSDKGGGDSEIQSFRIRDLVTVYPSRLCAVRESSGEEIELSPREISILGFLHEHVGEAVQRDQIFDHCWGIDYYPESRTLDQHMVRLRKRLELDPANPEIVETVRGVGYRIR